MDDRHDGENGQGSGYRRAHLPVVGLAGDRAVPSTALQDLTDLGGTPRSANASWSAALRAAFFPPAPDNREMRPIPHQAGHVSWCAPPARAVYIRGSTPAVKPPWGTLHAIGLNTGDYRWNIPLGGLPELTEKGISPTGTQNYGGPVVTAGGLLLVAATKDESSARSTGAPARKLREFALPAGGYATPATYFVNGRHYVVIACGGGKMGAKSGDAWMAFALPE